MKASDGINTPEVVIRYYEELRSYALGYRTAFMMPLGIDLFMNRGAYAWMVAWSQYKTYKTDSTRFAQAVDGDTGISVPQAIQPEITMLMANMILSCGGVS